MTDMDCAAFGDAAAELALGILTAPDRSAVLNHMDRCTRCQAEAASLAAAADRLLDLVPALVPPAWFESRTAEAFRQSGPAQAARHCRAGTTGRKLAAWRWRALAATAVAAAAAGLLGIGLHEIATPTAKPAYQGAALVVLRTPAGARAGEVVVTGAPRRWLVMIVSADPAPGRYYCYLRLSSGQQEFAGSFRVHTDGGAWVVRVPLADRHLIGALLVGPGGTEIASATFR